MATADERGNIIAIPDRPGNRRVDGFHNLLVNSHIGLIFVIPGRHCSKGFLRSKTWEPEGWQPTAAPRRAVIAQAVERPDDSLETLDAYYDPQSYSAGLYGPA